MNDTCASIYLILNSDLHSCPQPQIPEENCHISAEESSSVHEENNNNVKLSICEDTSRGEGPTYDVAWEDLHPYPLPAIPVQTEQEVGKKQVHFDDSTYAQFDELWDYPAPEWPECKKESRFKINLNPLQLRRKTICCLVLVALVIALLIGMMVTISVLMEEINRGKIS